MHAIQRRISLFSLATLLACPSLVSQTFTFGPPKNILLPSEITQPVQTMDLNGDGKTDVVVNSSYAYFGDGKGGFSSSPIKITGFSGGLQVAPSYYDVNGDGLADMVVGYPGYTDPNGRDSYPGVFAVWLGDGKANFTNTTLMYLPDGQGGSIVEGDFNKDGKLDFAFVNAGTPDEGQSTLTIFLNMGGGTFQVGEHDVLSGTYPLQIVAGDFNGDGKLDLAWGDGIPQGSSGNFYPIHYRYGQGDGTFGADRTYIVEGRPFGMAAADLNHDGKADLVVGLGPRLVQGAQPRIATLLAKSGGGFYWSSSVSMGAYPSTITLMDSNQDGLKDIVVDLLFLFPGQPGGRFGALQKVPAGITNATFSPLVKGGIPDIFNINATTTPKGAQLLLNTSKK